MLRLTALAALSLAACEAPTDDTPASEAAAGPSSETSGVTMANYTRLKTGMSYDQAVGILGEPGEEMSSNEMAGVRTVMYSWEGGSMGANMNAMFQNDKMVQKAQFGLE